MFVFGSLPTKSNYILNQVLTRNLLIIETKISFANITTFIKMFVRNETIGLRVRLRLYWRAGRAFSKFEKV